MTMDPGELARLILAEEAGGEWLLCETCGGDPKCLAGGDGRAYCPDCDNEGEVWQEWEGFRAAAMHSERVPE